MSATYSSLNHVMRVPLAAEVHSRPFLNLVVPESVTHLAVHAEYDEGSSQHTILLSLCAHFGVAGPISGAKHFFHDFGRFRLKWECHTEFATYTFAERHDEDPTLADAFMRVPLSHLPKDWLFNLNGKVMVAAHVVVERSRTPVDEFGTLARRVLEGSMLVGSQVLRGGEVWTDFLIQSDGFSRFIVRDVGLREQQTGRLVQGVLEIETYRMMALMSLPHAQHAVPVLNAIERELATLAAALVKTDAHAGISSEIDEQILLGKITGLAARVEKLSLDNSFRFSASQAYFKLVQARIDELREMRVEGNPTIGEFMERRLAPAMNTCETVAARQEALSRRIAHTNDLLRTRVGIVQEQQNRKILESMNKRAAQQLLLQQAVEGLSVAAISYYVIGLFGYAGKALKAAGWPVNADLLTGLLVPVVAVSVWLGLRRMHNKLSTTHI